MDKQQEQAFNNWLWSSKPVPPVKKPRVKYGTGKYARRKRQEREFAQWLWSTDTPQGK